MTAVERLDEIEARAAAATEGPWSFICGKGDGWAAGPGPGLGSDDYGYVSASLTHADAAFIAETRTDVPWLVEQVRIRDAALEALLATFDARDARALTAALDGA